MLHILNLNRPLGEARKEPHGIELWKDLEDIKKLKFRVFQTPVVRLNGDEKMTFSFLTSSKEAHLGIGRLSSAGKYHLAKLLDQEFKLYCCSELMLSFDDSEGFLVTRTVQDNHTVLTFYPAH
jgi:hypothetical protein